MKTLTFGDVPADLSIGDEPYPMDLNQSDLTTVAAAINQGIDSHLDAVRATSEQIGNKMHVEIEDSASMRTLLRRLCEDCGENGENLASSIIETLGYEWI